MFDAINFLSLGILILPLIYWEVPKVWTYLLFILIFVFLTTKDFLSLKLKLNFKNKNITYSIYLFVLIAILSSIFGNNLSKSIVGNYYRLDGLTTLIELTGFSIILGSIYKSSWNIKISVAIFVASIISCVWNNFGQINFLVGFILVSMPFGIYLFKTISNKLVKAFMLFGFGIQLFAIIKADTYVGLLGFLLIIPIWIILHNKKYLKYLFIPIIITISIFVNIWYKNLITKERFNAESRIRIYRNVFMGSLKKPLLGYGWANTDYVFESVVWPMKFNTDVYVDKAHMILLDIFSNTGLIGLTVYLYFIYLICRSLFKENSEWNNTLLLSLSMYFLYSLTNVTSISQEFIFWIIVGIVLSI